MAGHHKYEILRRRMSPESRAKAQQGAREDMAEMLLAQIRKMVGLTQEELASSLGIRQSSLSKLESQEDMQISTLNRLVEALGGEMEIIVKLPSGRISLTQFKGSSAA